VPPIVGMRTPVGELKLADLATPSGAGKCPVFVSQQLGFDQLVGNRRTIDRDERTTGAPARVMNALNEQFLAGAGLANDEHAGIRLGHHVGELDRASNAIVPANDVGKGIWCGRLRIGANVSEEFSARTERQDRAHHAGFVMHDHWLHDEVLAASAKIVGNFKRRSAAPARDDAGDLGPGKDGRQIPAAELRFAATQQRLGNLVHLDDPSRGIDGDDRIGDRREQGARELFAVRLLGFDGLLTQAVLDGFRRRDDPCAGARPSNPRTR
jgi:hypothetical protein